jgi:paired amphipathic helix protein Sin3a
MLYSRLLELKINGSFTTGRFSNPNPVAVEFGFHTDVWDDLDKEVEEAGTRYLPLLELCKRIIEQDQDSNQFEDAVRHLYGTKGYKMYTVDKLMQGIMKQVRTLLPHLT